MKRLAMTVACALTLSACSYGTSMYPGDWVNVGNAKDTMAITENGDSLIIAETHPDVISGKMETDKYVGTIKGGVVEVQMGMDASVAIDKTTGHLVFAGVEYKRQEK